MELEFQTAGWLCWWRLIHHLQLNTEHYNGSSWTEVNDLNEARNLAIGHWNSSYTAALCYLGQPPGTNVAELRTWDGTTWTESNADLNTARRICRCSWKQLQLRLLVVITDILHTAKCRILGWNSWTEVAEIKNASRYIQEVGRIKYCWFKFWRWT